MKSIKELESFMQYCKENPQQRFWQALRNWNLLTNPKENFILTAEAIDWEGDGSFKKIKDTFYI